MWSFPDSRRGVVLFKPRHDFVIVSRHRESLQHLARHAAPIIIGIDAVVGVSRPRILALYALAILALGTGRRSTKTAVMCVDAFPPAHSQTPSIGSPIAWRKWKFLGCTAISSYCSSGKSKMKS